MMPAIRPAIRPIMPSCQQVVSGRGMWALLITMAEYGRQSYITWIIFKHVRPLKTFWLMLARLLSSGLAHFNKTELAFQEHPAHLMV
jgi:hypothetical protein